MNDTIFEKNLRTVSGFQDIPDQWRIASIADLCIVGRGRVISQEEIDQHPGPYPVFSSQTSNNGEMGHIDTFDFDGEWVTWTTDGANAGTVFHRFGRFNCTNVCGTLQPKLDESLNLPFLHYHLGRIAKSYVSYIGNPKLMNDVMGRVAIVLPPLPEQRKIARILTTVDNLIEKTEAMIAKYQAIKQGMMHDLFSRGIDAHGHLRPSQVEAPDLYKQCELGWIPKEWKTCRVDEVGSVKLGRQRSPKHQSGRFTTPYLRVANVFDGFIDYSDVLEMDFTPTETDTYSLLPGDVLLNEGQSLELVGRSAIYKGEPYRFCFQNTLIRFRAYPPNDPRFCRGIFKFYIDIGRFMTIARQTTSVAHLGADRLAKLAFPCPEPDEQNRIASALLQHEKHCELDRAYKDNLVQQKIGLMQDLLTGKVRVKVDETKFPTTN